MSKYTLILISAMAVLFCVESNVASAQIFSSFSYNEEVYYYTNAFHTQTISGSTLPVNETISSGGAQATYNFSDNGSLAQIDISSTLTFTQYNQELDEETNPADYIEVSEPVQFVLTAQNTTSSGISIDDSARLYAPNNPTPDPFAFSHLQNATYQATGVLQPGIEFELVESSGGENDTGSGFPTAAPTGSDVSTLDLTLTPIPEPTSLAILSAFPILLLKRRRG